MSASAARKAALDTVRRVREREAYAHETLDAVLRSANLDGRDIGFATRLAYGTISTRGTLDDALNRYTSRPGAIEPAVGDALAVAAYELLFARTPARAAVSQGVELVRSVQPRATGLANAVLRRLAEDAPDFPWGDPETDLKALARLHGHPLWLAELWEAELGRDQAAAIMSANNEPAPLFLAHLPHTGSFEDTVNALTAEDVATQPCALDGCLMAEDPAVARRAEMVTGRRALVMDAGAQFAVHVLRPASAVKIAEIGSGRGSKALLAASYQAEAGRIPHVLAVDSHEFKLKRLGQAAQQLGLHGIEPLAIDAAAPGAFTAHGVGTYDVVLIDAPCSGLGTLRRHPDRRWRATPEEIESLAFLGARLLEEASVLVKPGGVVVYSTCTIARAENQDVIDGFLGGQAGRVYKRDTLADEVPTVWSRFVDEASGWFRSIPEPGGPDGHFVARLIRE